MRIEKTTPTSFKYMAPVSGLVVPLEQVPDPVFAGKLVGQGIAIDPTSQVLLAPCAGKIIQLHRAGHALTLQTESGQNVLLHIGLDTVQLKGKGFQSLVQVGDQVQVAQELIRFDADEIALHAKSLVTVMILSDLDEDQISYASNLTAEGGKDALLEVKMQGQAKDQSLSSKDLVRSKSIVIALPTGLHARPAALLVAMAKSYPLEIQILKGKSAANAKSVVAIMGLEIANGDRIEFASPASFNLTQANSIQAQRAVDELAEFLEDLEETAEPTLAVKTAKNPKPKPASTDKNVLSGVGVSSGVAIGQVHQIRTTAFKIEEVSQQTPAKELQKLEEALSLAAKQLAELTHQVKAKTDATRAAIFTAHRELLDDPDILEAAKEQLQKSKTAAFAWNHSIEAHAERLSNLNNELMANRANDLRDVGRRVLGLLTAQNTSSESSRNSELPQNAILIAENLSPSETVQLDRNKVLGFCTTTGGATSHVAILARSLGIPAIAGLDQKGLEVPNGTEVVIDGDLGELRLHPKAEDKAVALKTQAEQNERRDLAMTEAHKPAQTLDGQSIEVVANIGSVADARQAVAMGADGVGLLRSEFLFLERDEAPSEDEQHQVYQEIADVLGERTLVIRTLDVGGDKPLKYLPIEPEENPFLGVRGIRVGFAHPEVLREQLRAILRVKTKGKLCVMFPMIAFIEEFRKAKAMLEEERDKLKAPPVQVGIMIEVPSAALTADIFARECDFFSVGTNDLTQYTLAMDRGHTGLAKQVDALHPSVLRLIEMSANAARRHGKWIGVCGGLASDLKAVAILLGLGVTELSVSIPTIPLVKSAVREVSVREAQPYALNALTLQSGAEVRALNSKTQSPRIN